MPDLNAVFEAIKATINTVHDSGPVVWGQPLHDRDWSVPLRHGEQIRGWIVSMAATRTMAASLGRQRSEITWRVHHLAEIERDGGSRRAFEERLEAVRRAFLNDDSLGGNVAALAAAGSDLRGLQITSADEVQFGGAALHLAECQLVTLITA